MNKHITYLKGEVTLFEAIYTLLKNTNIEVPSGSLQYRAIVKLKKILSQGLYINHELLWVQERLPKKEKWSREFINKLIKEVWVREGYE